MDFPDHEWFENHLKRIRINARNRYTPELNIELPIVELFDALGRSKPFYSNIRTKTGKLLRSFGRISDKHSQPTIQKSYREMAKHFKALHKLLSGIREYSTIPISWESIRAKAKICEDACWKHHRELREEGDKINEAKGTIRSDYTHSNPFNNDLHYLHELSREVSYFVDYADGNAAKASNDPIILLLGLAGSGKTHLFCDIISHRLKSQQQSILLFGEYFDPTKGFWENLKRQLALDASLTEAEFFDTLNSFGKANNARTLLVIDALNETPNLGYWDKYIGRFRTALKKYPHIAIALSIRTGFEKEVFSDRHRKLIITEEHQGFRYREWEAVTKFFREFGLSLPEVPLLTPEFRNPLFLLLFCRAFQERSKKGDASVVFKGHEGATFIFENFIDTVSYNIEKQFGIDHGPKTDIWNTIIKPVAELMVTRHTDRIPESEVIQIVVASHPSVPTTEFLNQLEKNLILIKVPNYKTSGFEFRFPYQKFSDHLLARYFFRAYNAKTDKRNRNLKTAKAFFSLRTKLGKFLADAWNVGLTEALSIQCPEQLKGVEFFQLAPYIDSFVIQEAFLQSLTWRKPTAFSSDLKVILKFLNDNFYMEDDHYRVYDAFLSVASVPGHPFNAYYLHRHLSKKSMAERDANWSVFLHMTYGAENSVDRILNWGWAGIDKSYIKDEPLELFAIATCWLLTSMNRLIRDRATKALVETLSQRPSIIINVLELFKDVNDQYVEERLYAAVYGSLLINKEDQVVTKAIGLWVYDRFFKSKNLPANILTRDYMRGIVKCALVQNLIKIDERRITPPYKSRFPDKPSSIEKLKEEYKPEIYSEDIGYNSIWSSVMHHHGGLADFGRYVLGSAIDDWTNKRMARKYVDIKDRIKLFKKSLTSRQRVIFHAIYPYQKPQGKRVPLTPQIRFMLEGMEDDELQKRIDEAKQAREDLRKILISSLSTNQKYTFRKYINPYLGEDGWLRDNTDNFDPSFAERWVFERVVSLGYTPELHKGFDKTVSSYGHYGRSGAKPERIGKKYQWIALHELLGYISDHFVFKQERWNSTPSTYEGPWQTYARDIDPSCLLKNEPITRDDIPEFLPDELVYNPWDNEPDTSKWLQDAKELPNPLNMFEKTDVNGDKWLLLAPYFSWEEENPPEEERFEKPRRTLKYWTHSYLVRKAAADKVMSWAEKQWFFGDWMPRSHEFYHVFLGEYPSHPAFLFHYVPYHNHDDWTDYGRSNRIPGKILVTDDVYISSGSDKDCSTEHNVSVNLPAKFILDNMNLNHKYNDGRFYDANGELVALDTYHYGITTSGTVLFNKVKLLEFLRKNKLSFFWTVSGEKITIGGDRIGQPLGWLEVSGAYRLTVGGEITGKLKARFKKYGD